MKYFLSILAAGLFCAHASISSAHDTWVEVNTPVVRVGDVIHADLKLGNHGNDHRDFKLHSRITLAPCTLDVIAPSGTTSDLKSRVVATASEEKQGYWTARHVTTEPGLHILAHQLDILHGTTRAVKSAKTYFIAGSVEESAARTGHERPLGHDLEIIPLTHPVTMTAAGQPVRVKLLFEGKPLAGARVSFIPRGQQLTKDLDPTFERTTTSDGVAEFTPAEGNVVLIVVHHAMPERKGEGFEKTQFSATLTIAVPQIPYVAR
jgi:uncharacterized GH25 family protein